MIVEDSHVCILRHLPEGTLLICFRILVYLCQPISAPACKPVPPPIFTIALRGVVQADDFCVMSLNALHLLIGRILITLDIVNANVAPPVTDGQVLPVW